MTISFKMAEEKGKSGGCTDIPMVGMTSEAKHKATKKYVIITVGIISIIAIILIAVLVGMFMFTEAQKEIIKFTVNLGDKVKQNVESDPNTNVVTYHVSSPGQETWTVKDFNKGIEVVKVTTDSDSICYVNALNKSSDLDPSKINGHDDNDEKEVVSLRYTTADEPISDASFLSKTAQDMCRGIETYWVYPRCDDDVSYNPNITSLMTRKKRDLSKFKLCIKVDTDVLLEIQLTCCIGCCRVYCGCDMKLDIKEVGGKLLCTWYYKPCGQEVPNPYPSSCYQQSPGLVCPKCEQK